MYNLLNEGDLLHAWRFIPENTFHLFTPETEVRFSRGQRSTVVRPKRKTLTSPSTTHRLHKWKRLKWRENLKWKRQLVTPKESLRTPNLFIHLPVPHRRLWFPLLHLERQFYPSSPTHPSPLHYRFSHDLLVLSSSLLVPELSKPPNCTPFSTLYTTHPKSSRLTEEPSQF